ncbi:MAG: hypothetical protein CMF69_12345 [Magnetovibrio sp.]|nr:hypothetical protein [Magnetovibrio sp.]
MLYRSVEEIEEPYIFGITCLTAHVGRAYQISKLIKEVFKESIVVVGGLHPTALPEEALGTGTIDYVVLGEGEEVMYQLHRSLRGAGNPQDISGISFIKNGKFCHNPNASLLPDLSDIPKFPYHLFAHPKYDMGFLITSRGCPYRCSYCSQRLMTGNTYRFKTAEEIIEELELPIRKYHQKAIVFYDDNFCLNAKRVHRLCDLIVERKLHEDACFSVQTRADNVLIHGGGKLVRHMSEAGFTHVGFGLETGVQRLADLIRKDETVDCHLETTKLCQKYGIDVSFFMIFGLPTETSDDRNETFQIVKKAKVVGSKYNNLIPYPGTPLFRELEKSGRVVITKNWANFNSVLAMTTSIFDETPLPYVPDTCSEFGLKREIIKYNLRSFVNWESIAAVLGHTKGSGWFMLPEKWYRQPREVYEVLKIGLKIAVNTLVAFLPLRLTEPVMLALNPKLKLRRVVKDYDPASYVEMDWDKAETKEITLRLKRARDTKKETGSFSVLIGDTVSSSK